MFGGFQLDGVAVVVVGGDVVDGLFDRERHIPQREADIAILWVLLGDRGEQLAERQLLARRTEPWRAPGRRRRASRRITRRPVELRRNPSDLRLEAFRGPLDLGQDGPKLVVGHSGQPLGLRDEFHERARSSAVVVARERVELGVLVVIFVPILFSVAPGFSWGPLGITLRSPSLPKSRAKVGVVLHPVTSAGVDLVGIIEIAELLGVSRQRVAQLADTEGFPAPIGEIRAGRIWERSDIEAWAQETGRIT
jgi:predicted DNA-binding transcriptional regulator AlpA